MIRSRFARTFLAAALLVGLAAVASAESYSSNYWSKYPPPRGMHQERDGHWTPYSPPETPPPNVDAYVIEAGDTLWDMAARFLGDNLLWPVLAEMNPYIRDPHWIYPGDPLYVTKVQVLPQGELRKQKPYVLPVVADAFRPAMPPGEANCIHFVTDDWTRWDAVLVGGEEPLRDNNTDGDVVYMNRGSADGVKPGDEFAVMDFDRLLRHPVTFREMGQVVNIIAKARVLCTREHESTLFLSDVCKEVVPGARLRPWAPIFAPLVPRDPAIQLYCAERSDRARGQVVFIHEGRDIAATGHVVTLDVGAVDGLIPGDRMTIFREVLDDSLRIDNEVYGAQPKKRRAITRFKEEDVLDTAFGGNFDRKNRYNARAIFGEMDAIRRVVGEAVIVAAEPHTSTAVITTATKEILGQDLVEYREEPNVTPAPLTAETYTVPAPAPPAPARPAVPAADTGGPRRKRVVPEK